MRVQKGGSRTYDTLANQSKGQKVWSVINGNTLGAYTDKDKHQENMEQKEAKKYLRKSCYHCFEYSTVDSLTAFMWR